MWNKTTQPRSPENSGLGFDSVRLQSKHNRPSQRNKQPWYVPPGNRRQKIPWLKWPTWFCIFMCIVVFPQSCFLVLCVVSNIWETCSSSMWNFTSLLHQVKQRLILLLLLSWSSPTVQITTGTHEAVTQEYEKSPAMVRFGAMHCEDKTSTRQICKLSRIQMWEHPSCIVLY